MENKKNLPSVEEVWKKWYSTEAVNAEVPKMRIYDYLLYCNQKYLSDVALSYFSNKITYNELHGNIERAMASFQQIGVKEGDIVTFCMPTLPETIYAFFALNRLGAVAAMIDPTTNKERIEQFINLFDSKYLVMIDLAYSKLKNVIDNTKVEKVVTVSAADSLSLVTKLGYKVKKYIQDENININFDDKYIPWKKFIKDSEGLSAKDVKYKPNSPAVIVLTSGTTGTPKGAVLSNENLSAIAVQQAHCTNMVKNDKFLNIMPPFIAYGFVCGITNVLCNGLEMIIVPKFEKRTITDIKEGEKLDKSSMLDKLIIKHKPQHALGVPNFFFNLIDSPKMKNQDLSFIKSFIAGGDLFHSYKEELVNAFLLAHKAEYKINKGYGMTELASAATYTGHEKINKIGSVGIPLMLNKAKIVDIETNEELGYNQVGELYMSGPGVILGYFGNPKDTEKTFVTDENGVKWVKTGDLFSMDEDGVLFFKGRIKRMMIRPDGHNVFNEPIEEVLLNHDAVMDCAVVGIPSEKHTGEIPTAFVVLNQLYKEKQNIIEQELIRFSKEKLPERDIALQYVFADKLPYTTVGKVDYRNLEEEGKKLHLCLKN